jgi:Na+/H+ antiporter NhaD/arsenite permease-like protein
LIVAGFAHLGYADFALHLDPAAILGLVVDCAVIAAMYRNRLGGIRRSSEVPGPRRPHVIRPLLIKSSIVALITWVLFLEGFRTDLVAMAASASLLFTRRIKPQRIYQLIDWTMLAMFAGLFIVVAGLETTGFEAAMLRHIGAERLTHLITLTAVVAIWSNLVSNVPAVLLFRPIYPTLREGRAAALLIASAST